MELKTFVIISTMLFHKLVKKLTTGVTILELTHSAMGVKIATAPSHIIATRPTIKFIKFIKKLMTGVITFAIIQSATVDRTAQISSQYAMIRATMPTTAATITAAHPTEIPRRDATPVTTQVIACHTRLKALATSFTADQIFAATPAIRPNAFTAAHTTGITIASTAAILPIVSPRSFHACSVSFTPNNFFRNSPTDCAILPTSPSVLSR